MDKTIKTYHVPCNGCTLCCKNDAIYLKPEYGDDLNQYEWEYYNGKPILKHKPNKDCIYLGESGCTIHDRRPVVCREFSCIVLAGNLRKKRLLAKIDMFPEGVIERGQRLRKRYGKYGLGR